VEVGIGKMEPGYLSYLGMLEVQKPPALLTIKAGREQRLLSRGQRRRRRHQKDRHLGAGHRIVGTVSAYCATARNAVSCQVLDESAERIACRHIGELPEQVVDVCPSAASMKTDI